MGVAKIFMDKKDKEQALTELDKEFPGEYEKMKQFQSIFEKVLEASVYQIIPLNYVHGDLHPGNILTGKSHPQGSKADPYFIDFGNVVSMKGLLADPLFLAAYIFLGNSEQIANRLYNLQDFSQGNVSKETIHQIVQRILVENGFDGKGYTIFSYLTTSFKNRKNEVAQPRNGQTTPLLTELDSKNESTEKIFKVAGNIILQLMQETKYTVSGRYFQFLRTILPLGTSLTTLGKTLPTRTLVISALKSSLKGLFTGYIKTLIIKYPAQLANWYQRTKNASELKAAEVERGTVQT